MPIITLYGCKGGTRRTATSAAVTLGLLADGFEVTLVDINKEFRPFLDWADQLAVLGSPDWKSQVWPVSEMEDLAELERRLCADPNHVAIIDTPRDVSGLRSQALDIADVVVMPFASYLDANIGVQRAFEQIPRAQQLVGVTIGSGLVISDSVAEWMPVLPQQLPTDERLNLMSAEADDFIREMGRYNASEISLSHTLNNTVCTLAREITNYAKDIDLGAIETAPALCSFRPELKRSNWNDVA